MTGPTAMAAPHSWLEDAKQEARRIASEARRGLDPSLGSELSRHALRDLVLPEGAAVSGYWPLAGEIDIRPLLAALHARGHEVLLPVTPTRGAPLAFRRWTPGAELVRERFGTFCPSGAAADGVPQTLFIPLLAFDRRGRRLGYGGGYYDRTLAALPGAIAVGCGFSAQELDEVPTAAYDVRLAAVATERGVIWF